MKKIAILFFFLSLFSCEKDITVEFPFEDSRFFVFSEFQSGQVFQVKVDKTYPPTGEVRFNKQFLESTEVDIYEDGVFLEKLSHAAPNSSLFSSSEFNKPLEGHSYQIRVSSDLIPEASSNPEPRLPALKIDSVWASDESATSPLNPRIPTKLINVSLSDFSSSIPYLMFEIRGYQDNVVTSANIVSAEDFGELENPCVYSYISSKKFFKRSCFENSKATFQFYAETEGSLQEDPFGNGDINRIEVIVSSVNDSYFDYYYKMNEPLNFFTIFEGVNPTYTTFENGYGAILTKNSSQTNLHLK
ncbi:MAG: hypothetical protein ACI9DJ_000257 [Algoriphagus sp.]|jgi:hypothetical protein